MIQAFDSNKFESNIPNQIGSVGAILRLSFTFL